jgi:hypothetical protein
MQLSEYIEWLQKLKDKKGDYDVHNEKYEQCIILNANGVLCEMWFNPFTYSEHGELAGWTLVEEKCKGCEEIDLDGYTDNNGDDYSHRMIRIQYDETLHQNARIINNVPIDSHGYNNKPEQCVVLWI